MGDEVNHVVDWLRAEIQGIESYHNHKETMAWTATALFLAGGAALVANVPRIAAEHQLAASAIIFSGWIAIGSFVCMQFRQRWVASDTSEGLRVALTKLCDPSSDMATMPWAASIDGRVPGFPKFVDDEIAGVEERRPRWRRDWYKDPRWWSEVASYTLVLLTFLSAVLAIWNPPAAEASRLESITARLTDLTATVTATAADLRANLAEAEARSQARMLDVHESLCLVLRRTDENSISFAKPMWEQRRNGAWLCRR